VRARIAALMAARVLPLAVVAAATASVTVADDVAAAARAIAAVADGNVVTSDCDGADADVTLPALFSPAFFQSKLALRATSTEALIVDDDDLV
jgi:hypothetical protein